MKYAVLPQFGTTSTIQLFGKFRKMEALVINNGLIRGLF